MYGLSPDVDLTFLRGLTLSMVSASKHQLILRFADSYISLESAITVDAVHFEDLVASVPMVLTFLDETITDAHTPGAGTLALQFSSGRSILIHETWRQYESYQISHGDRLIVV